MAAAAAKERKPKRRVKKNVPEGIAHIAATFNNTIITISDMEGNVVAWASSVPGMLDRPATRVRLVGAVADLEVARSLAHRMTAVAEAGTPGFVEGSMAKLYSSEALVRAAAELLDASAPEGLLTHAAERAPADGWLEHAHRHAQVTTIYAGTSEIQRSIIAERGLGLPRSR